MICCAKIMNFKIDVSQNCPTRSRRRGHRTECCLTASAIIGRHRPIRLDDAYCGRADPGFRYIIHSHSWTRPALSQMCTDLLQ